ncbi:hemin-degrading factor [Sedimentitalea todarodis]|uniref:ChuX/HutX family heme-like substrate-binding protein n=1 Tax=Sedimentitalea todarodis TaxID=1631240 RepID=A0ABU3VA03_9RHOB|nr:ChuX/HutX family heme-like substrate-binding protein [Sedimentitalea todarodis]MDU9002908.1 ChuX/HutX family heme-like substrate-binding protein [Sedimentitalea todarodis]
MALDGIPTPEEIRRAEMDNPRTRESDLAGSLGISEAQLVSARVGRSATRLVPDPDGLMAAACALGEVMALTRNRSVVHEKSGTYANYHSGAHAAMVLNDDIDLRIFPKHWRHAFAVEKATEAGVSRSLQVFDAAGDAVHKIFLRDGSNVDKWGIWVDKLRHEDQSETLAVSARAPVEVARSNPDKLDVLRQEWARLTDTHQFLTLTARLRMNRLGAYRIAGVPFVRQLEPDAVKDMLQAVQVAGIGVMVFVGNRGCIQIHSGPIQTLKPTGPWQNVLDTGFNLHLRQDHVAEVWAVDKPTKRGPAVSVEAFDAEGRLIFQIFGVGKDGKDDRPAWRDIVAGLPDLAIETA